jgi:hypothetical protein
MTDLDVLPLRPYSQLLRALDRADLVFMRTPRGSKMGYVNAGFYLLRPTPPVRRFLLDVRAELGGAWQSDQLWMNKLLWGWNATTDVSDVPASTLKSVRRNFRPYLRWGTFNQTLVCSGWHTGGATGYSARTIALHAIGTFQPILGQHLKNKSKLERINTAIRIARPQLGQCKV